MSEREARPFPGMPGITTVVPARPGQAATVIEQRDFGNRVLLRGDTVIVLWDFRASTNFHKKGLPEMLRETEGLLEQLRAAHAHCFPADGEDLDARR